MGQNNSTVNNPNDKFQTLIDDNGYTATLL